MKPPQRYLTWLGLATGLPMLGIVSFNTAMDPSWSVTFPTKLNQYQKGFDERHQKAAYLHYRVEPGTYDSVIVGSSRATFIPVDAFPKQRPFNFGLSSLDPDEYASVIRFFAADQGAPKQVWLLMDFYGTKANPPRRVAHFDKAVEVVTERFYRPRVLLSGDTLDHSKDVFRLSADPGYRKERRAYYQGPNRKHLRPVEVAEHLEIARGRSETFLKRYFPDDYSYRENYVELLREIKVAAEQAEVMVLTAPISEGLFTSEMAAGRFDDYARWLRDLVTVFGRVFDSMGYTEFTTAKRAYHDSDHFYPERAYPWLDAARADDGSGYGMWIDESNIDSHIAKQRSAFRERNAPR
jgi:hypothetical protein